MDFSEDIRQAIGTARAKLRVGYPWWLRPFLASNVAAITLGRRIYVMADYMRRSPGDVERLLRHELVHVAQVNRYTLPLFLLIYAAQFLRQLVRHRSFDAAYRAIPLEVEAYAAEERSRL